MSGPTVTVQLDVSAVAGLLKVSEAVGQEAEAKGLTDLAGQLRSMRLALHGALRAHGWTPCGNGQWEQRLPMRGRRR